MSENSATIPAETRVPVCDPRAAYRAHQAEIDAAVAQVLDRGSYILGPEVAAFEREFADYLGAAHAVGVAGLWRRPGGCCPHRLAYRRSHGRGN